jgi:hypothetical protein
MIDRIVHHAGVISVKAASYRIGHTAIEPLPSVEAASSFVAQPDHGPGQLRYQARRCAHLVPPARLERATRN